MKKVIYIVLLCSLSMLTWSQSNIRVNNFWSDTYYINPAGIHPYTWQFSMTGRKQWTSFTGAPLSAFITGTYFVKRYHTQIGVSMVEDYIGYTNTINTKLSYSYLTNLNSYWDMRFGIAVCGQNRSYDFSKVTTDNPQDPAIDNSNLSASTINADLGLEITRGPLIIGLSAQNFVSLFNPAKDVFVNSNFLYAMYRVNSRNYVDYSFGIAAIESMNVLQIEANANLYIKFSSPTSNAYETEEAFNIGFYYRSQSEIGFLLGIDLSDDWHLSYTYDYNLSTISQGAFGTHEIMLRYRISPCNCTHPTSGRR